MVFNFCGQYEIREGYQAVFWYLAQCDPASLELKEVIRNFLHSDNFRDFCRPFIVKKYGRENNRFLRRAFNQDALELSDFKTFGKEELVIFFEDYSNTNDWREDRADFVAVMSDFDELIRKEKCDCFFLISKDWFKKGDKLLSPDSEFYSYFFLIIWLGVDNRTINVCEWSYD